MSTKIRFTCELPLLISSPDDVFEVWVDFGPATQTWHVVGGKLGDRCKRTITAGNATRDDLERAMMVGVELVDDPTARLMASVLVNQRRAEWIAVTDVAAAAVNSEASAGARVKPLSTAGSRGDTMASAELVG